MLLHALVDVVQIGDLVKDWRRMNVSFTRARSKLIIFGSRTTLQGAPILKEFFNLMDSQDWILPLPVDAHAAHAASFPTQNTKKRVMDEAAKENQNVKRAKISTKNLHEGLGKGRPILKDLMNGNR